jgi:para-nitrobenzyl esterase
MVWIPGGAFTAGSGSQAIYARRQLARRGDTVVVTINYRLGPLGFSYLAGLDHDLAWRANAGLLDQVAALRWVRDNIATFGGDPGNVTIFGESAGAMSVASLLGLPAARGLFHRAIAQSGASGNEASTEEASTLTELLLSHLGLPSGEASRLVQMPLEGLLAAQERCSAAYRETRHGPAFRPIIDGG